MSWDDDILGVTPWGTASGTADNASTPVDGDDVFFDANSTGAMISGPAAPVALNSFDMTGSAQALSSGQTTNINVADNGTLTITSSSVYNGTVGNTVTSLFLNSSSTTSGVTFGTGCGIGFRDSSVNNATSIGTGSVLTFNDTANCAASITADITVGFQDNAVCDGTLVVTTINLSSSISGPASLTGSGSLSGVIAISGGTNAVAIAGGTLTIANGTNTATANVTTLVISEVPAVGFGINSGTVTAGTFSITGSGQNTGHITGNGTMSGSGTNMVIGIITGDCTLSGGAKNLGVISGTLTAPAHNNGDGTWGYAPGALGQFGTLALTGITSGSPILGGLI